MPVALSSFSAPEKDAIHAIPAAVARRYRAVPYRLAIVSLLMLIQASDLLDVGLYQPAIFVGIDLRLKLFGRKPNAFLGRKSATLSRRSRVGRKVPRWFTGWRTFWFSVWTPRAPITRS